MAENEQHCEIQGIPQYLWTGGRGEDQKFEDAELLLRRYRIPLPEDFREDESIGLELFEIKDDSYNRTKYCNQHIHTLLNENPDQNNGNHYDHYGILSISIEELTKISGKMFLGGTEVFCELKPVHTPTTCNYSHTEACFFIDGVQKTSKKPRSVKTMFRRRLLKKLTILKDYEIIN